MRNDMTMILRVGNVTGTNPDKPTYVSIKGTVFDVSKNAAYAEKGQYHGAQLTPFHVLPSLQDVKLFRSVRAGLTRLRFRPKQSSPARTLRAPWRCRASSPRTACQSGTTWTTNTRPCWTSGTPSSASGITSWARSVHPSRPSFEIAAALLLESGGR